jgi:hypothetical protein
MRKILISVIFVMCLTFVSYGRCEDGWVLWDRTTSRTARHWHLISVHTRYQNCVKTVERISRFEIDYWTTQIGQNIEGLRLLNVQDLGFGTYAHIYQNETGAIVPFIHHLECFPSSFNPSGK